MTTDGEVLAVIDVEPSWAEDGRTLFIWYPREAHRLERATDDSFRRIGQRTRRADRVRLTLIWRV